MHIYTTGGQINKVLGKGSWELIRMLSRDRTFKTWLCLITSLWLFCVVTSVDVYFLFMCIFPVVSAGKDDKSLGDEDILIGRILFFCGYIQAMALFAFPCQLAEGEY